MCQKSPKIRCQNSPKFRVKITPKKSFLSRPRAPPEISKFWPHPHFCYPVLGEGPKMARFFGRPKNPPKFRPGAGPARARNFPDFGPVPNPPPISPEIPFNEYVSSGPSPPSGGGQQAKTWQCYPYARCRPK